jgi:arachidonate 15-lipoxygenase
MSNMLTPSISKKDQDQDPEPRKFLEDRDQYQFNFDLIPSLALHNLIIPSFPIPPGYPRVPKSSTLSPDYIYDRASIPSTLEAFDGLQSFDDLFPSEDKPAVSKIYLSDHSFAEQRLSGVNPMVLKRVNQDMSSSFTKELQTVCPSIKSILDNGNLYIADYTSLDFVRGGTFGNRKKFLPAPIAFFHFDDTLQKIVPLAIQIKSEKSSTIFTPNDSYFDWLVAKTCVQIADANHHEMATHLCWTHFVMGPFAISTPRKLATNHPVHILLAPHLRFLLAINDQGLQLLVNPFESGKPGGHVDRIMAGTIEESIEIMKKAYAEWSLDQFAFPQEIKNRGLEDVKKLPHFPYRDDGLLVWNAINRFVSSYLKYYYPTPKDIKDDYELQEWSQDLSAKDKGRVKGMPCQISTVEELIEIVTSVIFTCGPQHAVINFSQFDYMAYIPNMPQAAYIDITGKGLIKSEIDLMKFLPPKDQAEAQIKIVSYLSSYRHDQLGHYDEVFQATFARTPVKIFLQQFQQELNLIEQQIDIRNQQRLIPYPYLKPSLIPNCHSA